MNVLCSIVFLNVVRNIFEAMPTGKLTAPASRLYPELDRTAHRPERPLLPVSKVISSGFTISGTGILGCTRHFSFGFFT
jgi:hypothetical protein